MKTSTKIWIGIFIATLIGAIFTARFLLSAINIIDGKIVFYMTTLAWIGLGFNVINMLAGNILFIRFLKTRKLSTMLFFSTVPLGLVFGGIAFVLSNINNFSGQTFTIVKTALNINVANYNNYLWLGVVAIVYTIIMFFTFALLLNPVKKVQIATKRLAYGEVSNKINIGGNKQFLEIENSLNKINQNYKQQEYILGKQSGNFDRFLPKQMLKHFGKNVVAKSEIGSQIRKDVSMLYCNIKNLNFVDKSIGMNDNYKYLQVFMNEVIPIIKKSGGFVAKYLEDGIVAVFANSQTALECAIKISNLVATKKSKPQGTFGLKLGMVVDNMQGVFEVTQVDKKKTLDLVSDCILDFKKIDEFNKVFGSTLVFTKEALNNLQVHFKFLYRYIGNVDNGNLPIFECLDVYEKQKKDKLNKFHNQFEEGVRSYLCGRFNEAKNTFEKVYKQEKTDSVCYTYYNKCCEKSAMTNMAFCE